MESTVRNPTLWFLLDVFAALMLLQCCSGCYCCRCASRGRAAMKLPGDTLIRKNSQQLRLRRQAGTPCCCARPHTHESVTAYCSSFGLEGYMQWLRLLPPPPLRGSPLSIQVHELYLASITHTATIPAALASRAVAVFLMLRLKCRVASRLSCAWSSVPQSPPLLAIELLQEREGTGWPSNRLGV